jgi:hypothetical protein
MSNTFDKLLVNLGRTSLFVIIFFFQSPLFAQHSEISAEEVIRQAIERHKAEEKQESPYSYDAYTKTALRFPPYFPFDTLLNRTLFSLIQPKTDAKNRKRVRRPAWMPPELDSEILYLAENVSEVYVKGKKRKEKILHSRVSGELTRFSFLGNVGIHYDPYKNRFPIPGVNEMGMRSPLAEKAWLYYAFEWGEETDSCCHHILLRPRRKYEPVFQGEMRLDRQSLAVRSLDIWATPQQGVELLDTLHIRQEYSRWNEHWVPVSTRVNLPFSLNLIWIKVPFQAYALSEAKGHIARPDLAPSFFNKEVVRVMEHTNAVGIEVLDSLRPVPLSPAEAFDYHLMDSLKAQRSTDRYLDSLTRTQSWLTPQGLLLLGLKWKDYRHKLEVRSKQLISSVGFNPMEGLYIEPNGLVEWSLPEDRNLKLDARLRYGFGSRHLGFRLGLTYQSRPLNFERLQLSGGDYISEFSGFRQVGFFPTTQAALLSKRSLMRLYRKQFVSLGYRRELLNGLMLELGLSFASRQAMPNVSEFSWSRDSLPYTPNFELESHRILLGEVILSYQPANRYLISPTSKFRLGSPWPRFSLNYAHALPGVGEGAADFSKISFSVEKEMNFGFLGYSQWRVSLGTFLRKEQLYFPDFMHFTATPTLARSNRYDAFFLADLYEFSTDQAYLEAHIEQEFSNLFISRLPVIRRLRLREFLGLHFLARQGSSPYLEMNVGLEKWFLKVLRLRLDIYFPLLSERPRSFALKYVPPGPLIKVTE